MGDYLGDLTNEIDGDDNIVEGVFPGPKNYASITKKNKTVCKVKGFSLNYKADFKWIGARFSLNEKFNITVSVKVR